MRPATKIKLKRLEKGMSQVDFAKRLGISPTLVSFYESGKAIPPQKILFKMAEILGCSPEELAQKRSNEDDQR